MSFLATFVSSREQFVVECLFILEILTTGIQSLYRDPINKVNVKVKIYLNLFSVRQER